MPAAIYNFEIEKGSDFSISFQYNDAAGVPIDLSGKCVQFKMLMSNGDQYVFHQQHQQLIVLIAGVYQQTI